MGRRTLQIKRIVIEIEIALVVFAGHGRLYEFCSGESLGNTLDRYQTYVNKEIAAKRTDKPKDHLTECNALWTGADLLKTIRYVFEDHVGMSTINLVGPVEND